jgi:hypothetical protein
VATLTVRPRPTPEEYAEVTTEVSVDEDIAVLAASIEDWVTPRQGRHNNVEAALEFALGEQTSRLLFRLDQLEAADDTAEQLVLRFEERDGIAKLARLTENGLDVELFHILTFT